MEKYLFLEPIPLITIVNAPQSRLIYLDCEVYKGTLKQRNLVNETAFEIISLLNGNYTFDGIVDRFSLKYDISKESAKDNIKILIDTLTKEFAFEVKTSEVPVDNQAKVINQKILLPSVATLEITSRCNLKCRHCYGSYSAKDNSTLSLNQCKKIIDDLSELNVNILEITGGDPSVHNSLCDIIRYALEKSIPQLMIMTNGVSIEKELLDLIVANKERVFLQIDLHSLDSDYFDWFTNSVGHLNEVKQNIVDLVNAGASVRVVSIITHRNLQEIELLAEWCDAHNVKLFMPSVVVPLGRATKKDSDRDLYLTENEFLEFNRALEESKKVYPSLFLENVSDVKQTNCGAVVSHISINSNGDVKLCNMDTMDCFRLPLDNVFQVPLEETLEKNKAFIDALFDTEAPDPNSMYCKECDYRAECAFCLLRSLRNYSLLGDRCKWYAYHRPEILKYIIMGAENEGLF